MRAVIQRVSSASVTLDGEVTASIKAGLVVLLGVESTDTQADIEWLSGKLVRMRLFDDEHGVGNKSVHEIAGEILVISQFTLFASTRKGNRPSWSRAAPPEQAQSLYNSFLKQIEADLGRAVVSGQFGANMKVALVNDGPVTILIDSHLRE